MARVFGKNGNREWRHKTDNAAPVPMPKPNAAFVRLKHPREPGVYYCKTRGDWVRKGWTTWKIKEWEGSFSLPDPEGRNWEFFGYSIPLYFTDPDKDELPAPRVNPTRDP